MNLIDKTIGIFSPKKALQRQVAREKMKILNTGYGNHGANKKKKSLFGWYSRGGSTKEDIDDHSQTLRERSRDLYMGTPIATGSLKTIRTNVVGSGLRLNSQIDYEFLGMSEEEADAWETITQREFSLWADSIHCDAQRMNNFYELQQLAFLSFLMSGDVFALLPLIPRKNVLPYDLRVHLIEADRVCDPDLRQSKKNIINGVEIGNFGEVVAYYVAQFHPLSYGTGKKEWQRIEKFGSKTGRPNIIHLMEAERPEQRRGVPLLAPVIEALKQLGRYTEAELMAAVVSGMFTVFIKSSSPEGDIPLGSGIEDDERMDDKEEYNYELGNGAIIALGEGEDVKETNPGRPNTAFDGFVTSICRQIGTALELPYELLIKHFTASYSASRAALLEAWKMFRMRRTWLANDFCQPIYEEWLAEAIAKGRIYAPGFFSDPMVKKAYCGAEWNGPSPGQIDPLKEVNAAEKRVLNGFSTRARETVELTGGDYYRNIRQLSTEKKLMEEAGLAWDPKNQPLLKEEIED
jgi:lambda family phage portal protein